MANEKEAKEVALREVMRLREASRKASEEYARQRRRADEAEGREHAFTHTHHRSVSGFRLVRFEAPHLITTVFDRIIHNALYLNSSRL